MPDGNKIEQLWQAYVTSRDPGIEPPATCEAWHFCDNEKDANECGALVVAGTKTATCSLLWEYEAEGEELPKVGDYSIVTNWTGEPLCIIETVEVEVREFKEVDAGFAHDEGEGDRSLSFWRRVHWDAFSRICNLIGRNPTEEMPLVCERFRVVFRGPHDSDRWRH